jgi:type VI secretion system secreted protein VgrG
MAASQDTRNFRISSTLGPDVLLFHRMAGNDGMSELGEYRLDLLSEKFDIAIDDVLGQALTVELDIAEGVTRQFNGIVTRFVMNGRNGRYGSYQATLRPWLWLLTRSADCHIFQDKDAVAIIKEIFNKYALADFDLSALSSTPPALPYCVQYRETDFAFVSRLMERFGFYYYFRHAGGRHTLVLADSVAAHSPIVGNATLHFASDAGARDAVYDWHAAGEILADAQTLRAFNFETPTVDLTAKSSQSHSYGGSTGTLEIYDYPGAYLERPAGEAEAKVRLESSATGQRSVQGAATAVALAPGGLFKLRAHPRADQNVDQLAVSANYRLYSDRFETEPGMAKVDKADLPPPFDCSFTAIPKEAIFRAVRRTPAPVVRGPQTAIVVGKSGEEIWTDKYGRVRVKFHWDRVGDGDSDADACSCWVRVAQAWAGKRFGQLIMPRVGQEVVVSFLEGDPDQPIVTGAVYNAQNMPPLDLPEQATRSTLKTNSSLGGEGFNEVRFEDKKGSEEVFIQAEKDYNRVVKNNDTLKVGFEKADKGDQTIDIKNDQAVTIGNDQKQTVKHDQTVEIGNDRREAVKHDQTVEIGNDRKETVKNDQTVEIGNDRKETVKNDQTVEIGNDQKETVKNNQTVAIGGDQKVDVDGAQKIKVGTTIAIEAGTSIELKVGGSSIKIEAAKITIKSAQIEIAADANMEAKAGAMMVISGGAMVKIN